jgi:hypothetical protein
MNRHSIYLSLAIGTLCVNSVRAQVATGVALEENGLGRTGRDKLPMPAVIQTPGTQLPPPGGNPLSAPEQMRLQIDVSGQWQARK